MTSAFGKTGKYLFDQGIKKLVSNMAEMIFSPDNLIKDKKFIDFLKLTHTVPKGYINPKFLHNSHRACYEVRFFRAFKSLGAAIYRFDLSYYSIEVYYNLIKQENFKVVKDTINEILNE